MKKAVFNLRSVLAILLIAAMMVSMASCAVTPAEDQSVQNEATKEENVIHVGNSTATDELSREDKELIADLLGDGSLTQEELENMDEEKLDGIVQDIVDGTLSDGVETKEEEAIQNLVNREEVPSADNSNEIYDENGAMKDPFDVVYPELVEDGTVTYDEETLLVKMNNSRSGEISDGMAAAGVAALEAIVPMETATWYEAKLVDGTDASVAIEALRELKEVLIVEYNFEIQTSAIDGYKEFDGDHDFHENDHHKDQWHMHHCGIPDGMAQMETDGGSSSVIVAVIDTGVDYDHEDLSQNMWVNSGEIPDNNIDDDGNGYVDDYYGVNIVTGKGNGDDDNGHGTHVAGIIAAQNNNLGVVGIAYNVKVMTVKAAMASGTLNQSDVAKAILYAYEMGAEVINMSFGSSACSIAVQDALAIAYSRCVLVASAGNDGLPNEGPYAVPNYPAALTYVLGVMSVDQYGVESSFTNWDVNAFNGVEYELYAPGDQIMSTLPNDSYGVLSGTSMAAPVVAAIAAILRSEYSDRDLYPTKFIYGQLASTSGYTATCLDPDARGEHNLPQIVNLYSALTELPKPEVSMQDYSAFDTESFSDVNNGDGVIEAGETIALGLTLQNRWGMSENTVVTIDALNNGIADPYVTIQNPSVNYGSVGTYSTQNCGAIYTDELLTGWENPFYITIAEDCPNDYIIKLNVTVTCENGLDEEDNTTYTSGSKIWLYVRNGLVLPQIIDEDMVLTPDNLYIIPNSTVIQEGVTVRVEAGTNIQFWSADPEDPYADSYIAYLLVNGNLFVEGTKENPVYIYPSDLMDEFCVSIGAGDTGYVSLVYADITNFMRGFINAGDNRVNFADHCVFHNNYPNVKYRYLSGGTAEGGAGDSSHPIGTFEDARNCVFYNMEKDYTPHRVYGSFDRCLFADSVMSLYAQLDSDRTTMFKNCVFLGNADEDDGSSLTVRHDPASSFYRGSSSKLGVFYNEETDTSYVCVYDDYDINPEDDYYIELAKMHGGGFAIIDTVEELQFIYDNWRGFRFYLGVYYDHEKEEYVWSDGSSIGSVVDTTTISVQNQKPKVRLSGSTPAADLYEGDTDFHYLYEIPGYWTTESYEESCMAYLEETQYNHTFYGNAILNRISTVTDVERWLRPGAPSGDEYTEIPLGGNYWGTTNETAIGLQMVDYTDYISYARLMYEPYLTTAPENTFPFVTSVTVLNKDGEAVNTVGNEPITVRVTFNRDMDTTIPLSVKFGSAEPYGDYTIPGSYVDARTWEGSYTLNTLIENGVQYWNISNGCSATDDLQLYPDTARFFFNIDTTAAQALIMQGNATDTGIQLTWTQDDFDTLMGYNVYRSTSEDGYYQRLNSTVIPADTMEWFDDTVEPGVVYYYNFTVVKTDLSESEPSGKITIMSKDTMAPNIYHSVVATATTGSNLIISATVTDNLYIASATVYFRTVGETEWKSVSMTNNNSKYSAIIAAENLSTAGLEYYIEAYDGVSYTYKASADAPYTVAVLEAVDESALGDVNGDGTITNLDALILLYAINDKYNMTAEEFARADLNGDGVLTAAEALRILQYVNGTVGSVVMS